MKRFTVSACLVAALSSCGGASPASGVWSITGSGSGAGSTITRKLTLRGDGSATFEFDGGGTCTGAVVYSGFTWDDVANTGATGGRALRFAGSSMCTGTLVCSNGTSGCDQLTLATTGTCPYTIGTNATGAATLTVVNCFGTTNQTDVFTRAN
jgi:hypothetical protein